MKPLEIHRDDSSDLLVSPLTARWEPLRMDDKHRAFAAYISMEAKRRKHRSKNPKKGLDIVGGGTVSQLEAIAKRKMNASKMAMAFRVPTITMRPIIETHHAG